MREAGGKQLVSVQPETRATAIRIGNPASWEKAVKVIQATGGACEQVSEVEIAIAKAEIGAEGIGCEPASAVTLAGLKKFLKQGFVKPQETVILVLTGNLLKDPDFTMEFHRGELFPNTITQERVIVPLNSLRHPPIVLDANLDAILQTLERAEKSDPAHANAKANVKKKKPSSNAADLALPATSANLGPALDAAALAMDLYVTIDARARGRFFIRAAGHDLKICRL